MHYAFTELIVFKDHAPYFRDVLTAAGISYTNTRTIELIDETAEVFQLKSQDIETGLTLLKAVVEKHFPIAESN